MHVRLYDIDPSTLSPDLDSVTKVFARGVDAIVVSHLYGYPADFLGVQALASEHGIPLIEDAAQGAGGALCNRMLGTLGDIAILSFGRGKGMTSGSGGAVIVRTPELAGWVGSMRGELGSASAGGFEAFSSLLDRLPSRSSRAPLRCVDTRRRRSRRWRACR